MGKIPIFRLEFDEEYRKRFHEGCEQIFDEGYLTNHTMVKKAEEKFRQRNSSRFAVAVSNGTTALEVALRSIGVTGKEVILPSNTFIATFIAIINAGGIPVICDIEEQYFGLCPKDFEKSITPNTKAAMVVHIGGHISPAVLKIKEICQSKNITLVEDAAHAHFAELNGVKAGNIGDIGSFSFHMTKVITSGEGGMLTMGSKELFENAISIRQFGMDKNNSISHVRSGSNFKMNEFTALALQLDLERSAERIGRRRAIAKRYQQNLQGTKWKCVSDNTSTLGSYYKQIIIPPGHLEREMIATELTKQNIALTGGVYNIPLHEQPVCQNYVANKNFPISALFSKSHICPPCYPELQDQEVDRICDILKGISP